MNRLLLIAAISVFAVSGYTQDYPSRAINLIVPNPPGGMNQIHAQPLGAVLEKLYKQPAPVLNKPGAGHTNCPVPTLIRTVACASAGDGVNSNEVAEFGRLTS